MGSSVFADLAAACGDDPSLLCEWAYDATDSERAAELVTWLVDKPLRILLIVVGAWVVHRFVHRVIDRGVARLVAERSVPVDDADDPDDTVFENLQEKAAERLRRLRERTERARQRTVTLGAVLRSVTSSTVPTASPRSTTSPTPY